MKLRNGILHGTIILSLTGFITRFIGFFYRIFLSNTIGAQGIGLLSLTYPIIGLSFAISSAGIQTAISKYTAEDIRDSEPLLKCGGAISVFLATIIAIITYCFSDTIATVFLLNSNTSSLIKLLSFSLPLSSLHNCINASYLGMKSTRIPAITQLSEQLVRILSVFFIYKMCINSNRPVTAIIGIYGIIFSEICSCIISIIAVLIRKYRSKMISKARHSSIDIAKKLLKFSVPLTFNRVLLYIFQAGETILIPAQLMAYGMNNSEALSIYGVLTGMAIPLIMFPATITNSASAMLLPTVSKAQSEHQENTISKTISASLRYSLLLGIFSTGMFLVYGAPIGSLLFNNQSVGTFIIILAWLCPFLYIGTTLAGILNGLGMTTATSLHNTIGIIIRIAFIIFFTPQYGIKAYLVGLLISNVYICAAELILILPKHKIYFDTVSYIIKPIITLVISLGISLLCYKLLTFSILPTILNLGLAGGISCILYYLFWFL